MVSSDSRCVSAVCACSPVEPEKAIPQSASAGSDAAETSP